MLKRKLTGVVLAGGKATRMGGQDKGLLLLDGKPLWEHVADKLLVQVDTLAVSANRNLEQYSAKGYPVVVDSLADFPGPLAGMLAAMQSLHSEWYLFCPCDMPDIPPNLAKCLMQERKGALAVWANDGKRAHPTIALLHNSLVAALKDRLENDERRVMSFLQSVNGHAVFFTDEEVSFANVNTPEDLQRWRGKK